MVAKTKPHISVRRFAGGGAYREKLACSIRVAHLTDQHVGRVTPLAVQLAAVAAANAENPDLVVITGDFVCHSLAFLDQLEHVIGGLEPPVLAVLGNHDHWSGAENVRGALAKAGAEVLDNQWTTVRIRGERLQVVGLDDAFTGHADRQTALKGLDPRHATLGLSHIAEEADGLWAGGVPLVLSGHTHGGQVSVLGLNRWSIGTVLGHRYVHGLYGDRAGAGAVYVGAGIGSGVVPLRWGERARREVTIFELGAAEGALDEHHQEQVALPGRRPTAWTLRRREAAARRKQSRHGGAEPRGG
jgi:uncharacterized protein